MVDCIFASAVFPRDRDRLDHLETEHDRVYNRPVAIDSPKQSVLLPPVPARDAEPISLASPMRDVTPQQPRNPEVLPPEEPNHDDDSDEYDLFH